MPPPPSQQKPIDTDHMLATPKPHGEGGLPAHKRSGVGPVVGIVIILILLLFGGLYFWGARLNRQQEQLPFIPGDSTQIRE